MLSDPWLDRWMPLIVERAHPSPVLEIGCGHGDDTVTLTRAGLQVMAFDLSPTSVTLAKLRAPRAQVECRNILDPFPGAPEPFGAVIASLSLHYFSWPETISIVQRIRDSLRPGGIFVCRLNSTEDHHFGAGSGTLIEENFYLVDGQTKRFFDRASLERLFGQDWRIVSMEHMTSRKYVRVKAMWEVVLERV